MSEESKSELKNEPENEPEKEAQDSNVLHRNKKIFIIIAVAVVSTIIFLLFFCLSKSEK